MQIIPGSSVTLYSNIKIRRGMGPIFSSSANRTAYFNQHIVRSCVPTTYIPHDGEVRVDVPLSVLKTCNYMSFTNPDFENITWYVLITDYKYYNNECSVIYYVIDPLMTFMHQFEMHECMISRQHLSITDFNKGELNPYDPSIYQFTTGEEVMVTPELEKPEYNIQKYYDTPGPDGKYMLTSNLVRTSDAYAYDCGEHVMGVIFLAPLSLEKLDEGVEDAWSTSQDAQNFLTNCNGSMGWLDLEFAMHGTTAMTADYAAWNTIASDMQTYINGCMTTYNMPQDVATAIMDLINNGGPSQAQGEYKTVDYAKQLVKKGIYSTGDTPSAQWTNLMQRVIDAGGTLFNVDDPYTTQNGTFVGQVPHSSFMRGYNIIAIPSIVKNPGLELFSDVIEKLTTWDSISQIIGIYAINDYVFSTAFVSSTGIIPSPGDIATDNIYTIPTSFDRLGHGQQAVSSKKLLTYPYSYLRVQSPDGNVKEYRYEWFKDVTEGNGSCKFKIMGDLNSHPSILMAPIKYRRVSTAYSEDGQDMTDAVNVNLDEMICYDEFAQVPFVTDAYLTYLSNQVMRIHGQNTSDFQDQLTGQKIGAFASFLGNLGGAFNQGVDAAGENSVSAKGGTQSYNAGMTKHGVGLVVGGVNAASTLWNAATSVSSAKVQIEEASDYLAGNVHGDIDWGRFNSTKPAHANDIYHPGTNGGIYHYLKGLAVTDFIVTYVQLKPAILQKLDNYFKLYGYNEAGRSDIPYFYNFIHNTGTDDVKPHWEQDADGDYVTYIQTMDAHITGIPYPFCQYLEGLFNSGYRFINGDALIQ